MFDPDCILQVRILMLMAVVNDITTAISHYQDYSLNAVKYREKDEVEELFLGARSNYFFKLACAHTFEAVKLLGTFIDGEDVKEIVKDFSDRGKDAHERLIRNSREDSRLFKYLVRLRNNLSFHYDEGAFKKALDAYGYDHRTQMIAGETVADYRFIAADDVQAQIISSVVPKDETKSAFHDIAQLQGDIIGFLHKFMSKYYHIKIEKTDNIFRIKR